MTRGGGERLSDLRAIRTISPSQSLKEFLSTARVLVDDVETMPGEIEPVVFAADSLRLTIFERRVRADEKANDLLRKVHARMESPFVATRRKVKQPYGKNVTTRRMAPNPLHAALWEVEEFWHEIDGSMVARANAIANSTRLLDFGRGIELSLVIDKGSVGSALVAQSKVLLDAEKRMEAGKKLIRLDDEPIEPLYVPFMQAPITDLYHQKELMELLSAELPVTGLQIGPIEWKLNTVYERKGLE